MQVRLRIYHRDNAYLPNIQRDRIAALFRTGALGQWSQDDSRYVQIAWVGQDILPQRAFATILSCIRLCQEQEGPDIVYHLEWDIHDPLPIEKKEEVGNDGATYSTDTASA